ncbi:hypothetical protein KHO57_gp008 [Mycobacterium phage Phabba]|uniref:Uncharacterized protein n=1 Tax=Mycobacterium phage Phabba TaxID=2027899 RepID=A0A249XS66_9CAUD|nr:hypothetical protein KHO57_gp008 [Mycobacterium phage Phabba]ASZ74583.1 hypothetical protein SEA_PHABBA_8 [Mycobacterium phage Phabba]
MNSAGHYINRQGNLVTVRKNSEGQVISVEVHGVFKSNRSAQAQMKAAKASAGMP